MGDAPRFHGESAAYRAARNELLAAEIELRRQLETVAATRRGLPLGGEVREDYVFSGPAGPVRMSELFRPGKDTLIVYNFMYGPAMAEPCPLCTSILDGFEGQALHVADRAGFAVVGKSAFPRLAAFAQERGWRHLPLYSSEGNSYNLDYGGESASGDQLPMLNVFVRRDGKIHHFYATEMFNARHEQSQDPRHVDLVWPLWNLLDLTPEGRGSNWWPKLRY
jgi:predicted dithiol-disulfide oxidoreductase (DUF899 family)